MLLHPVWLGGIRCVEATFIRSVATHPRGTVAVRSAMPVAQNRASAEVIPGVPLP